MTDRLEEIRSRWGFATTRPWVEISLCDADGTNHRNGIEGVRGGEGVIVAEAEASPYSSMDMEAIAAAPADIQYLISEVERLRDAYDTGYADGAGSRKRRTGSYD